MKRLRNFVMTALMIIMVGLFGIAKVDAATVPSKVTTDNWYTVNYFNTVTSEGKSKTYPIIVKTVDNKSYYVYCMDLDATYGGKVTFNRQGEVDPGYIYILNHIPNTGDKDKDFYITQLAVWYYGDYLNQNNHNLPADVKKFILYYASDRGAEDAKKNKNEAVNREVSVKVMDLVYGAKAFKASYKKKEHTLKISENKVSFTNEGEYYVSSEIGITVKNVDNVKYSMDGTPKGSQIVKGANGGVVIKIPAAAIPEGKKLTFTMNVKGNYVEEKAIYYYHSEKYQKLLFGKTIVDTTELKDSIKLSISNVPTPYNVPISKTDITQSKEVPGATLVVKDEKGNVIETWVSTTEVHKITLKPGKYSLTETIAPEGYKLSTTTIEFLLDANGGLFVKDSTGKYVSVSKVVMINELKDSVSIIKRDSKTGKTVAGAVLRIKDANGNVVNEFTTTDGYYSIVLNAGQYSVSEVSAPQGYKLSNEIIYFELTNEGTIKVKNNNGEFVESAVITFYNQPEDDIEIVVPSTGSNNYLMIIAGAALILGGIAYARKTIKEC